MNYLFSFGPWIRSPGIRRAWLALLLGLPLRAAALPLISEVYYDAPGADAGQTFVEIHAPPGTRLDGWRLEGINGANGAAGPVVTLFGVVPEDGFYVVADDAGGGVTWVPGANQVADIDLQNGPDSLVLLGPGGVRDAVGYGTFGPGETFAGEGEPAPDVSAGHSLERWFADLDTNDNALDFAVLSEPTPGWAPVLTVPEPPSLALLSVGVLLTCAARGRQRS